jgi:hypothetical protein
MEKYDISKVTKWDLLDSFIWMFLKFPEIKKSCVTNSQLNVFENLYNNTITKFHPKFVSKNYDDAYNEFKNICNLIESKYWNRSDDDEHEYKLRVQRLYHLIVKKGV